MTRHVRGSSTLYVGNLSFFTTEQQIYELFAKWVPPKEYFHHLNRMFPCIYFWFQLFLCWAKCRWLCSDIRIVHFLTRRIYNCSCVIIILWWHYFMNRAGQIRRIIMGLDNKHNTPCGFCFIEYVLCPPCNTYSSLSTCQLLGISSALMRRTVCATSTVHVLTTVC